MKKNILVVRDFILYNWDQFRLRRDRRLAEGGMWSLLRVIIPCIVSTLIVGLILCHVYGSICMYKLEKMPDYANSSFHPKNVFDAAYYLLFTNGGQNLYDNGGHLLGATITTLGIVLIAFLTSALTSRSERKAQRFIDGESWYRMKNHIVIFGASDFLYSIIAEKTGKNDNNKSFKDDDNQQKGKKQEKYLIVTTQKVADVRREVFSFLEKGTDKDDFVFIFGDRTSKLDISRLSLEKAKEVYIIGDSKESDDIESYRDSNNMDCVIEIGYYLKDNPLISKTAIRTKTVEEEGCKAVIEELVPDKKHKPLPCHVMFEYQTSFAAFQFCEIPKEVKEYIKFMPFNYYDLWARKVIVAGHADNVNYSFLDTIQSGDENNPNTYIGEGSDQTVHLIILGMTKMGIAIALQAAHICHFPNFKSDNENKDRKRTRITFIDSNADIEKDYLKGRFSCMMSETRTRYLDFMKPGDYSAWTNNNDFNWNGDKNGWYDIEWDFIKGRIESDEIQDYITKSTEDKQHIVTIAVCLPKSHQSIAAAMYLPESVYTNCLQVLVYQRRSGTIVNRLRVTDVQKDETARYTKIFPFGMMDTGYDSSLEDDTRAKLVSYIYDSGYAYNGEYYVKETKDKDGNISKQIKAQVWDGCDIKLERYFAHDFKADSPSNTEAITATDNQSTVLYRNYPRSEDSSGYDFKWQEKFVMDKMSSAFNANSIATKLRGIGLDEHTCNSPLSDQQIETLKRVEHNRWNIEKMLTGFRSLNEEEMDNMTTLWKSFNDDKNTDEKREADKELWKTERKKKKGWPSRAHLDICSVEELVKREKKEIIKMDENLSSSIPYILTTEKIAKQKKDVSHIQ